MHKQEFLKDKHALVTGAGGGIGSAIARLLDQQGVKVTLLGRNIEKLNAVASELNNSNIVQADVTDDLSVKDAISRARETFGPIEILINNAGMAKSSPYLELSSELWHDTIAVNLNGVHYCSQAVLPDMISKGWGRIINIASTAAQKGHAYVSAYVAAKHAVLGLTRSLALEFAKNHITVNAICPGYTDTQMVEDAIENIVTLTGRSESDALAELVKNNPQKRLIQPGEIAESVHWLCQPAAASITGQAISIAGGEVMS